MTGGPVTELSESLLRLVRDVPDYPKPGIVFKDITPLLGDGQAFARVVDTIAAVGRAQRVDAVVGIEARGFIIAAPVAYALGVGFVPIRKEGKLPGRTHARGYALEYGEAVLEVHEDAFAAGARVLVVDDVLATGGTAAAAEHLVGLAGGQVTGFAFLMELAFLAGRSLIPDTSVDVLLTV